jgi:hypothetical protein
VARQGSSLGQAVHSIVAGASKPHCSEHASSGAAGFNSMVRPIPPSCAHLDLAEVERELIRRDCNVSAAAKALGVPVHDLRLLTRARPRLMDVAFEAVDRSLDEAEAIVREASITATPVCGLRRPAICCAIPRRDGGVAGEGAGRHGQVTRARLNLADRDARTSIPVG